MHTPPIAAKRRGRPPTGRPVKRPVQVMLDERVAEALRVYGDDNLSIGVALAAAKAAARVGIDALKPLPDVRTAMAGTAAKAKAKVRGKAKAKTAAKAAGRPVVGVAPRVRTNLHLYPELVEQLRVFGDGIVSQGIERAAIFVRAVRL